MVDLGKSIINLVSLWTANIKHIFSKSVKKHKNSMKYTFI